MLASLFDGLCLASLLKCRWASLFGNARWASLLKFLSIPVGHHFKKITLIQASN